MIGLYFCDRADRQSSENVMIKAVSVIGGSRGKGHVGRRGRNLGQLAYLDTARLAIAEIGPGTGNDCSMRKDHQAPDHHRSLCHLQYEPEIDSGKGFLCRSTVHRVHIKAKNSQAHAITPDRCHTVYGRMRAGDFQ